MTEGPGGSFGPSGRLKLEGVGLSRCRLSHGARPHIAPLSWMWTRPASSKMPFGGRGFAPCRIGLSTTGASGHAHVVYPLLSDPVLEHPESNPAPLLYLADIEKKLLAALDGDPAYSGFLGTKPAHETAMANSNVFWFRQHPWELSELDEAASVQLPPGWKPATAALQEALAGTVPLFEGLMSWAGRPANRFESILVQAHFINSEFATPLPAGEVKHTVKSVAKYRVRWEANGWHSPRWIQKQAARGRASGKARRAKNAERDLAIVDAYDGGETQTAIARRCGLSQSTRFSDS